MSENSKKKNSNVVLTMPIELKKVGIDRSNEVYGDYRSFSKYVRDLIAYDLKHKVL